MLTVGSLSTHTPFTPLTCLTCLALRFKTPAHVYTSFATTASHLLAMLTSLLADVQVHRNGSITSLCIQTAPKLLLSACKPALTGPIPGYVFSGPLKPGQPTSSSSSLASSWVDTSSRPCGFAFAGAGSICSRRASPGPAELRRTGTPGSGGVLDVSVGVTGSL